MRWTTAAVFLLSFATASAIGFGMLTLRPLSWSHPVQVVSIDEETDRTKPWSIASTSTVQMHHVRPTEGASNEFANRLGQSNPTHPLIVHLAGVLDASDQHAHIWLSSDRNLAQAVNCSQILDRLRSRPGPTLLYIEARLPADLRIEQYPESDAWRFLQVLRGQLESVASGQSNQSLSVVMDFTTLQAEPTQTSPYYRKLAYKDLNGNGLWECSEWLAELPGRTGEQSKLSDAAMPPCFVWTPTRSRRWDFPITPLSAMDQPESSGSENATLVANSVDSPEAADDLEPLSLKSPDPLKLPDTDKKIDVLAPSIAMSLWSGSTPWPTRDADHAATLAASWQAALHDVSGEKGMRLWLTAHAETAQNLSEYRWTTRIVDMPLPWLARRDLLLCMHDIEILRTDAIVHRHFQSRWEKLRQRSVALLRQGIHHTVEPAACRRLRIEAGELSDDCDIVRDAHELSFDFGTLLRDWVNHPVSVAMQPTASSVLRLDPACEVLTSAVALKKLLSRSEIPDARSIETTIAELEHHSQEAKKVAVQTARATSIDVPFATACREQRYRLASQWRAIALEPIAPLTKDSVADSLTRVASDIAHDMHGGTMPEHERGRRSLEQIQHWLEQLGSRQRLAAPRPIDLMCRGSEALIENDEATLELIAQDSDGSPLHGSWKLVADPSLWDVKVLPAESSDIADSPRGTSRLRAQIKKLASATSPQQLCCTFETDSDAYQLFVPLHTAARPFASIHWTSSEPTQLLPNSTTSVSLQLRALDSSCERVAVRLLAHNASSVSAETANSLSGTFQDAVASQLVWDDSTGHVLAELPSVSLSPDRLAKAEFPPAKVDAQMPLIDAQWLRLEIRDLDSTRVQFVNIYPAVARPSVWLDPHVRFDHRTKKVTLAPRQSLHGQAESTSASTSNPGRGFNLKGTTLQARLIDLETGRAIAKGSVICEANHWALTLSSAATDRPFDVVIDACGWNNAFRYQIDPQASVSDVPLSPRVRGLEWESTREVFGVSETVTTVAVNVLMSDGEFVYGQDEIAVGIDHNHNRYLDENEILGAAQTPVRTQFTWTGIDEFGRWQISNRVATQHFEIPLLPNKNSRIDLLAELRRGTTTWRAEPQHVLVDYQAPRVSRVVPAEAGPYEWGHPITLTIEADDDGLSGVQRVEAAWAVEGNLEFSAEIKPLPAGSQSDGRWTVTLPTKDLPTGVAVAMIRAVDRVENTSEIKTMQVNLQTAAEIAAFHNRPTGSVEGRVLYVTQPVAEMTIRLQREAESDAESSSRMMEVVTDTTGRFVFPEVVPGKYQVIVSGLYRGVRRQESVSVTVSGHQMVQTSDIQIR